MFSLLTVGPDSVTLRGPTEARHGEAVTFECETSHSNPPASIQWTVNNATRNAEPTTRTEKSPRGGYVTKSSIVVSLGFDDKSKMVVCRAVNAELGVVKTEAKVLSVICKFCFLLIVKLISGLLFLVLTFSFLVHPFSVFNLRYVVFSRSKAASG